jgi:RNA polymerase sigma factor (sigma-70 family)
MDPTTRAPSGRSTSYFEALLAQIRDGDEAAREAAKDDLIRDAYPRALQLTRYILRGDVGAAAQGQTDHVCSVSYEKFARKLKEGMPRDFANLREMLGYLDAIIRHTATDEVRKFLGPKFTTQFPRAELPPECVGDVGTRLRFYEMIEGLSADERRIVELKFIDGFNDTEIAEVMEIDRRDVGRMLRNALRRLKKEFDEPGTDGKI